jgi:L-amino acid N-acyltransferase YncA
MDSIMQLNVRPAAEEDLKALSLILNEIIVIGGSTALEKKLSTHEFKSDFIAGPHCLCCFVAEDEKGIILGFQSLSVHKDLPHSWADIATFVCITHKTRGVGSRLFQDTIKFARRSKIECINATIRADNPSGLGYYSKMGFEDYSVEKGVPLLDGTLVDSISKKYSLEQ